LRRNFKVLIARLTPPDLVHVRLSVIFVHWCHMGQDLAAIETDPVEGGMRERVTAMLQGISEKRPPALWPATHMLFHDSF